MTEIVLNDGTVIRENLDTDTYLFPVYEYYYGKRFAFGVPDRFTKEELQNLYNRGYFS